MNYLKSACLNIADMCFNSFFLTKYLDNNLLHTTMKAHMYTARHLYFLEIPPTCFGRTTANRET